MKKIGRQWLLVIGFMGPCLVILLTLNAFPLGFSLWLSLHKYTVATRGSPPFIGFNNFIQLFSDLRFGSSLVRTSMFLLVVLSVEFILGLGIALLLNRFVFARRFRVIRTLIVIPMMICPVVVGYTFRLLYHPTAGPLNHLLTLLRVSRIEWIADANIALFSVAIADIWEWTPFVAIMLLAGLQSLPRDPFEAATVDGASSLQQFRYLIVPLLFPVIAVAITFRGIEALKAFDAIYVLTGGGPGVATELTTLYIYATGFKHFKLGYAAAMSWVFLFIILGVAQLLRRLRTGALT